MIWDTLPNFSLVNKQSRSPDVGKVCKFFGVLIHIDKLATLCEKLHQIKQISGGATCRQNMSLKPVAPPTPVPVQVKVAPPAQPTDCWYRSATYIQRV